MQLFKNVYYFYNLHFLSLFSVQLSNDYIIYINNNNMILPNYVTNSTKIGTQLPIKNETIIHTFVY